MLYQGARLRLAREPRKAVIWYERFDLECNQPVADEGESVEHGPGLVQICALENDHRFACGMCKIDLTNHPLLVQCKDRSRFVLQMRCIRLGRNIRDFLFQSDEFHGELSCVVCNADEIYGAEGTNGTYPRGLV